jgi:DNA invertase Pin-like site-specific DNA recombinase
VFGALAQYERSLIKERVLADLGAARKLGRVGGRSKAIPLKKLDAINIALGVGIPKSAVCRNFDVKNQLYRYIVAHGLNLAWAVILIIEIIVVFFE